MKMQRTIEMLQVTEAGPHQLPVAGCAIALGILAVVTTVVTSTRNLAAFLVGAMFIGTGVLLAWSAETKTTTIVNDSATVTVKYQRRFGGRCWVRTLGRSSLVKLDIVKGQKGTKIYLDTILNEQIEIGHRNRSDDIRTALESDAIEIANFLNIPVNVITLLKLRDGISNFYNPRDRMAAVLQRPTQAQLDEWTASAVIDSSAAVENTRRPRGKPV